MPCDWAQLSCDVMALRFVVLYGFPADANADNPEWR